MEILGNLVEGLMQIDRDGRIIPAMAESYDVSADGRTYTFHLRDAKWSNGAFVLEDYLPGTANIQLRKNEQYWDAGNVHLDGLAYQVVNSPDTALSAFKNGTLKVVKIDGEHVQSVMKDDYADYWAAMHEAEEIVMREAAIAPLYFQSDAVLIADGVQGVEFHAVGAPRVFKNAVMK